MQPASKRVKGIYSVIASPNRLEILRILNTRGPLSYSDLKMMAGFKSKKESGKFAYHLRKLVRQVLVSLNRSERKYVVTNLGRLVLNLTRQIEEQSMLESGRLYVRTSKQMMEEFNSDKILQSLVRESGMPLELAQRIASEAEQRIYKFQTNYLTAPLIRELVNALLIEHGLEEYRHKLTRLGLPVYDVSQMVEKAGSSGRGLEDLVANTAHAVLSEYLMLAQLPKDVADSHLNGDIHISRAGVWGFKPDNVFVDVDTLSGFSLRGGVLEAPRHKPPEDFDGALELFAHTSLLLSREVAVEACFEGLVPHLARFANGPAEELRKKIRRMFFEMGVASSQQGWDSFISIAVGNGRGPKDGADVSASEQVTEALLSAYGDYVGATPSPRIRIVYHNPEPADKVPPPKELSDIVSRGGDISVSNTPSVRSYIGLAKNALPEEEASGFPVAHSLSINLPRVSYDSSKDETYFKAKVAMQIQIAVQALDYRKRMMAESAKKGLLPALSSNPSIISMENMPLIINLVGLNESLVQLAGEKVSGSSKRKMAEDIIQSAVKVSSDRGKKMGNIVGVSMLEDSASSRFATIDGERFGKPGGGQQKERPAYGSGEFLSPDELEDEETAQYVRMLSTGLNGGLYACLTPAKTLTGEELLDLLSQANRSIPFYRLQPIVTICRSCGLKMVGRAGRCRSCRSTSLIHLPTVENRLEF